MILGGRYFQLSNALFHFDLTPIQLTVYSYLVSCAGQKEVCWPSMKRISDCCGCSKNAARAAIDVLEHEGFIRRVHTYADNPFGKTRQTNNTYYILPLPPLSGPAPKTVYREGTTAGEEVYKQNEGNNLQNPP